MAKIGISACSLSGLADEFERIFASESLKYKNRSSFVDGPLGVHEAYTDPLRLIYCGYCDCRVGIGYLETGDPKLGLY